MSVILTKPGHRVTIGYKYWRCTCSPDARGNGGGLGPRRGGEIHLRSAGVPQRSRSPRLHEGSYEPDNFMPACLVSMGCLCVCHAAGLSADEPCDTSEERAHKIAAKMAKRVVDRVYPGRA